MPESREGSSYSSGTRDFGGRSPKEYGEGRVCQSCGGKISRYNEGDYCHRHKPIKFPRVRGKLTKDKEN